MPGYGCGGACGAGSARGTHVAHDGGGCQGLATEPPRGLSGKVPAPHTLLHGPRRLPVPPADRDVVMPATPRDEPLKAFMLEYRSEELTLDPSMPAKKRPPVW